MKRAFLTRSFKKIPQIFFQAEELHRVFLEIYRENSSNASLCPEIERYSDASRDSGQMLQELARQLSVAGRDTKEIMAFSNDILNEASTWRLLRAILGNKERNIDPVDDPEATLYSEYKASEAAYAENPELRHLRAVLDWLELEALDECDINHYSGKDF